MNALMMMRLGAVLVGTSSDLGAKPNDEGEGEGVPDESEDETSEDEGKGKGSGDDAEDSDGGDDAEDSDGGDESGEDSDDSGDDAEDSDGDDQDGGDESGEDSDDSGDGGGGSGGGDARDEEDPDRLRGTEKNEGQDLDDEGSDEGVNGVKNGGHGASGDGGEDLGGIASELLDAMEAGESSGLKDNNSALGDALEGEGSDALEGECPWSPYSTEKDVVYRPSKTDERKKKAEKMKQSVKTEIAAIRAKLRNKFLQARRPEVMHGVRKGNDLSERRLVNSMIELRSGRRPTRPDWKRVEKEDCSLTAAVVVDESGSMSYGSLLKEATRTCIAISEALDTLGAPVMVVGPRNAGAKYQYPDWSVSQQYAVYPEGHEMAGCTNYSAPLWSRTDSVVIDVFKDWHERASDALPRFAAIQACGSTPLSDGIQFALQELQERTERHRVVFVITDGYPDNQPCVKWQVRTAAEAGVTIVGIGIGDGAAYVRELFPVAVWSPNLEGLPRELLAVLENIMFPKRARKMNLGDKKMKAS